MKKTPWYKNSWLLFILAFPGASVIMGGVILYVAISHPDSVVEDNYYKEGLAINQQMQAIEKAREMGLTLQLSFTKGLARIESNIALPPEARQLRLVIAHNLNSKLDKTVMLNRENAKSFAGTMGELEPGLWYISVTPIDDTASWRIKGKINNQQQQSFLLTPKMR